MNLSNRDVGGKIIVDGMEFNLANKVIIDEQNGVFSFESQIFSFEMYNKFKSLFSNKQQADIYYESFYSDEDMNVIPVLFHMKATSVNLPSLVHNSEGDASTKVWTFGINECNIEVQESLKNAFYHDFKKIAN